MYIFTGCATRVKRRRDDVEVRHVLIDIQSNSYSKAYSEATEWFQIECPSSEGWLRNPILMTKTEVFSRP